MNDIKNNLIDKIKAGDIEMNPRWHFVLRGLLAALGVLLLSLVTVYLGSFILFFLRESGVGFAPLYGFKGVSIFVLSSPWLLIAVAGLFALVLYVLVSRYSFSYKRPLIYTLGSTVLGVLLMSVLIGVTDIHGRAERHLIERGTTVFTPLYGMLDQQRSGATLGTVTEVQDTGFILQVQERDAVTVTVSDATRIPPETTFSVGDELLVIGKVVDNSVDAIGVRPAPEKRTPRDPRHSGERPSGPR